MDLNYEEEEASDSVELEPENAMVKCFNKVRGIFNHGEIWKYLGEIMAINFTNLSDSFKNAIKDLEKIDSGILVAGETSAGKSTLINRLIGEEILVTDVMEATTKVYRITHSDTFQIKTFQKNNRVPEVYGFKELDELRQKLEELEDVEEEIKRDKSIYRVDVMIPLRKLKTSVTIVDTPGICDSEELKDLLEEYIPKAVAFVFVIDVSRAGGLHTDRLVKTMEEIQSRKDVMQCFDPREALFIRNKWDCVKAGEKRKERVKSKLTKTLKEVWPCAEEKNIFDTALTEIVHDGKYNEYSSSYQKFEAAIQDLIKKKENMTVKTHGLFLEDVISKAMFHLNHVKSVLMKSSEENDITYGVINRKIMGLSRDIQKKKGCAEVDVNKILQKLTHKLSAYIFSEEFKNVILRAEPDLISFSRMRIDGEISKRIEKATERWIIAKIPAIIDKEINSLLEEAAHIYQEINEIKDKLTGISQSMSADSLGSKGVGWSIAGGFVWVINRAFWAAVVGPQAAMVMSTFWLFSTLALGSIHITNLLEDAEDVVKTSFEKRMKSLNEKVLFGIMETRFGKHLNEIHDNIFNKLLPEELQNLQKSLEIVQKFRNKLTGNIGALESWLRKLEQVKKEVEEIDNLSS